MNYLQDGEDAIKNLWQQGDENIDARAGCSRKDHHPV